MKKSDLRTGMRVTTKRGRQYIVFIDCQQGYDSAKDFIVNNKNSWNKLSYYNEDLTTDYGDDNIDKVEIPNHPYRIFEVDSLEFTTIWKRPETKRMTLAEIESALGYPVEIIK